MVNKPLSIITITVIAISLLIASCTTFYSPHYVGEKYDESDESAESSDSAWLYDGDVFHIHTDATGEFYISTVEWDDNNKQHIIISREIIVSELDDYTFLNFKEEKGFIITRLIPMMESNPKVLGIATFDSDVLDKEIEAGNIKASYLGGGNYLFEGTKDELDEFVRKNIQILFDYDALGTMQQITETK